MCQILRLVFYTAMEYIDIMSGIDYRSDKVDIVEAGERIRWIVGLYKTGEMCIVFSAHSNKRLKERGMFMNDVLNILFSPSSKVLEDGTFESGSYRYRYGTPRMVVVVAFWPDGEGMNIVTAWRK